MLVSKGGYSLGKVSHSSMYTQMLRSGFKHDALYPFAKIHESLFVKFFLSFSLVALPLNSFGPLTIPPPAHLESAEKLHFVVKVRIRHLVKELCTCQCLDCRRRRRTCHRHTLYWNFHFQDGVYTRYTRTVTMYTSYASLSPPSLLSLLPHPCPLSSVRPLRASSFVALHILDPAFCFLIHDIRHP